MESEIYLSVNHSQHVVMLVNNPCTNDSRVIKSAEVIAKTGRRVTVVCRQSPGLPIEEELKGVVYLRVEPVPFDWKSLGKRLLPSCSTILNNKYKFLLFLPFLLISLPVFLLIGGLFWSIKKSRDLAFEVGDKVRADLYKYDHYTIMAFMRKAVRYIKRLERFFLSYLKKALRSVYWLIEADEFSLAAEPKLFNLAPDIIHAHDLTTLPLGGRVARAIGAKLIYDSHELEMHRNAQYSRITKWRRRYLESKYIRRADSVITVSESIADHLRDEYKIDRPCVVMNAPEFDDTVVPSHDIRGDLNLSAETPLALYVGSVTINRGIEQTIRALVHLPQLHFATVGPLRPATEIVASSLAAELGVSDRVHFVSPVLPREVVGYIRSADVSVLAIQNVCLSYYYCMPNKLMESVFAGVPVVVANLIEMRRFVEAYDCGVVMDETDPQDIARAITKVLTGRKSYILTEEVRGDLANQYGWPSQAQRLSELYDFLGNPLINTGKVPEVPIGH